MFLNFGYAISSYLTNRPFNLKFLPNLVCGELIELKGRKNSAVDLSQSFEEDRIVVLICSKTFCTFGREN